MKRFIGGIVLVALVAALTFLALPLVGWSADTGAAVLEGGANSGADTVNQAQMWIDFFKANTESIFTIIGAIVLGVSGLALLIRAQVRLWKSDAAGNALTSAVTLSGAEAAVRQVMDAAPAPVKKKVWQWACQTFKFPLK